MKYRLLLPRTDFLDRVRTLGLDDQSQPVRRFVSPCGGEPLRDVLRRARPGEEIILASYCPFPEAGPFREFGAIYVRAEPSDEVVARETLPLAGAEGETYFASSFVLRAYNAGGDIRDALFAQREDAVALLETLLTHPETRFVDARFPTYGCHAVRVVAEGVGLANGFGS